MGIKPITLFIVFSTIVLLSGTVLASTYDDFSSLDEINTSNG
jgi:hypothetical protein